MPGFRDHPLDAVLESMVKSLSSADTQLGHMSKDIKDFDSVALTPEEDTLVFHNPSLRFAGQVHPQTGQPYTNAQAAQKLLADIGPDEYTRYVEDFVNRAERRGAGDEQPFLPPAASPAPAASPFGLAVPEAAMMPPAPGGPV
jgi:hypothetical protein